MTEIELLKHYAALRLAFNMAIPLYLDMIQTHATEKAVLKMCLGFLCNIQTSFEEMYELAKNDNISPNTRLQIVSSVSEILEKLKEFITLQEISLN